MNVIHGCLANEISTVRLVCGEVCCPVDKPVIATVVLAGVAVRNAALADEILVVIRGSSGAAGRYVGVMALTALPSRAIRSNSECLARSVLRSHFPIVLCVAPRPGHPGAGGKGLQYRSSCGPKYMRA